ncbi:MAG: hypothetical protein ACOC4M_17845, partial [Promethearchaeia archaeon]
MELSSKRNKKILIGFSVLFVVLLIIPPPQANKANSDISPLDSEIEPKGIRSTVVDDPTDSATVTWYTE